MERWWRGAVVLAMAVGGCGGPEAGVVSPEDTGAADAGGEDVGLEDGGEDSAGEGSGGDALGDLGPDVGGEEDVGGEDVGPADTGEADVEVTDVEVADTGGEDTPMTDADGTDADPWIGTACAVNGRAGVCLETADCTGDRVATPGFCPGPANIQCCTEPPPSGGTCDEMATPRPNEGLAEAPGVGGCPDGMVPVTEAFCVDQYEAALVELLDGGQERSWSPYFNPGTRRVRAVSIAGAVPQGYINGDQAAAACEEAGKRLCTDVEWLRACQGPQEWWYPYGEARQDGVCNDARGVHPAVEYFGTTEDWIYGQIGNPCLNQLDDGLALTGDHLGCQTAEGAFDMMGNLHEWTADPAGTFRGGFYVDTVRNGPGCLYRTTAHTTGHWDYSTGFRCCADR